MKVKEPRLLAVNIDTIVFVVTDKKGSFNIPHTETVNIMTSDSEIRGSYQNRVPIRGKHGTHSLYARTMKSGTELQVEGSLYAYLYGQNVYTDSDMKTPVIECLKQAVKALDIKTTSDQRKRWTKGDITLKRVDLAVNIRVESESAAIDILSQIRRQLGEQRGTTRTSGTTVYWAPRNGKEFSIGFYAKGPQMRGQQKRIKVLPGGDRLLKDCETILRIELRLQASELRALGLDKVRAWDDQTAERVFRQYMRNKLKLFSVTSGPITAEELSGLPSRLRHVLVAHKAGAPLSAIYAERTLRRQRSDFNKLGIDLHCPNQAPGTAIPLPKVLSPKKAIISAPQWMIDAGLVPPARKPRPNRKKLRA